MSEDHSDEFDCIECGRHIIRIIAEPTVGHLCGLCIHSPGWFENPELRDLLDPTYEQDRKDGRLNAQG